MHIHRALVANHQLHSINASVNLMRHEQLLWVSKPPRTHHKGVYYHIVQTKSHEVLSGVHSLRFAWLEELKASCYESHDAKDHSVEDLHRAGLLLLPKSFLNLSRGQPGLCRCSLISGVHEAEALRLARSALESAGVCTQVSQSLSEIASVLQVGRTPAGRSDSSKRFRYRRLSMRGCRCRATGAELTFGSLSGETFRGHTFPLRKDFQCFRS